MTSPLKYAGKYPTLCGVCRRRASHIGYTPHDKQPIMWLCEDPICITTAKRVYRMKPQALGAYEEQAQEAASNAAGQFLDEIARTDLAVLDPDEWREFWRRAFNTYHNHMRDELAKLNAPF
jgi:hypothetical protein